MSSTSLVFGVLTVGIAYGVFKYRQKKYDPSEYTTRFPQLSKSEILKQIQKNYNEKELLETLDSLNKQLESPPSYSYFKDPLQRHIELEKRKIWSVKEARERYLNKQQSF
eukprot:NODE_39_length_29903_cov_0.529057.p19 type:complete len:110 gc:universal NODE_39_length_29903_cov_0.529057:28869-29198(+)